MTEQTDAQRRLWRHRWIVAAFIGLSLGVASIAPMADAIHRFGIDILLPLRHQFFGPLYPPSESDAVVVSIDEETYHRPPFSETPRVAWTPMLAKILNAIDGAGARVIGLDLIYPTSLDKPGLLPGYDKPLLMAMFKAGRANRLILGKVRLSQQSIVPYKGQQIAVGGAVNIRALNILLDEDNVARRYPNYFSDVAGGQTSSFAMELAKRGGVKTGVGSEFLINYNTGANDIPTYSFADLYQCAEEGDRDYFSRHFAGKTVIIGSALDVEDRRFAAKRFANSGGDARPPERCRIAFDAERFGEIVQRRTMPGVFIHAAALNTLTHDNALRLLNRAATLALTAASGAALAILFFLLTPLTGALVGTGFVAVEGIVSLIAFQGGIVFPVVALALGAIANFTVVYAFRFVIEDRTKRRIKHAFGHFLAPSLVERLSEGTESLKLGGEIRRVTILFSDIAGYTTLSEKLQDKPDKLVELLNRYFTVLTEAVEKNEGYVVTFIGDALMGMWGAPASDENADRHAVAAALDGLSALDEFNRTVVEQEFGLSGIATRFGINTGLAVVGNTGSATRLYYSPTGDTTNLAARLEGANKLYGTHLMIGEETARGLDGEFVLRRLDRLVVKGKTEPINVFEVMGRSGAIDAEILARIGDFEAALSLYERRDFAAAKDIFQRLAADDSPSRVFVERCEHFEENPPEDDWDGSFVSKTK